MYRLLRPAYLHTTGCLKMTDHGYPTTRRTDFKEEIHGKDRADPYRWMEESSGELKEWVTAQNKLSSAYTNQFADKDKLYEKLKERYNFEKHGIPWKEGPKWYYFLNSGIQNRSVLYTKKDIYDKSETPKVFIDPNTMGEDGNTALGSFDFSTSGKYIAYITKLKGSDWGSIHVRDCETGEDFKDLIEWVKFSGISWSHDEKGFFYSAFEKMTDDLDKGTETTEASNQRLMYHRLGTDQSEDIIIYHDPDHPKYLYSANVTEDGEVVVISFSESCGGNGIWYMRTSDIDLANYKQSTQKIEILIDNQDFVWLVLFWFPLSFSLQ